MWGRQCSYQWIRTFSWNLPARHLVNSPGKWGVLIILTHDGCLLPAPNNHLNILRRFLLFWTHLTQSISCCIVDKWKTNSEKMFTTTIFPDISLDLWYIAKHQIHISTPITSSSHHIPPYWCIRPRAKCRWRRRGFCVGGSFPVSRSTLPFDPAPFIFLFVLPRGVSRPVRADKDFFTLWD